MARHGVPADREQRVEHVGEVLAQLDHDAGEEAVGLVHLRGAAPLGGERLLGVGVGRQRVALEHGHPVTGPPEGQRRAEPADARPDDDDVLARHASCSAPTPSPSASYRQSGNARFQTT